MSNVEAPASQSQEKLLLLQLAYCLAAPRPVSLALFFLKICLHTSLDFKMKIGAVSSCKCLARHTWFGLGESHGNSSSMIETHSVHVRRQANASARQAIATHPFLSCWSVYVDLRILGCIFTICDCRSQAKLG